MGTQRLLNGVVFLALLDLGASTPVAPERHGPATVTDDELITDIMEDIAHRASSGEAVAEFASTVGGKQGNVETMLQESAKDGGKISTSPAAFCESTILPVLYSGMHWCSKYHSPSEIKSEYDGLRCSEVLDKTKFHPCPNAASGASVADRVMVVDCNKDKAISWNEAQRYLEFVSADGGDVYKQHLLEHGQECMQHMDLDQDQQVDRSEIEKCRQDDNAFACCDFPMEQVLLAVTMGTSSQEEAMLDMQVDDTVDSTIMGRSVLQACGDS